MFKIMKVERKKYKYLLAYSFSHKVGDKLQYSEGGNGTVVMNLTNKICSLSDISEVENLIRKNSTIDNLTNVSLMSFNIIST